ncbi:MAG: prolyl oligopeptidase family serine peptidase [Geodermatophilaceae bacterium]
MTDSFPRRQARTRRFSLGAPRDTTISPDGDSVLFLRSRAGSDPVTCLWVLDVGTGQERLLVDPRELAVGAEDDLPEVERARRERSREQAGGIVGYATDQAVTMAAFVLSGQLHVTGLAAGRTQLVETPGDVIDPRPDPTGSRVAYVSAGALHVRTLGSGTTEILAAPDTDTVTYGLADFVAAEEMDRMRGYWWSPDGSALLVARVDDAPVRRWHIADPANPERPPTVVAYPAAGTPNAVVSCEIIGLDGVRVPVGWDSERDEYLARVVWDTHDLLIVVQPRDQRALRVLRVDPATGAATLLHEDTDPAWVDIVDGVPAHTASGALVQVSDIDGLRRLLVDGEPVTDETLLVRDVLDVDGHTVLFRASEDPMSIGVWSWGVAGLDRLTAGAGVHSGQQAGGTVVVTRRSLDADGMTTTVRRNGHPDITIASMAESPGLGLQLELLTVGERALYTAVLLPSWHHAGTKLPVLMDPYGGPHVQRVMASRAGYLTSQWLAEQGFAVVVVDGRGTPGRGSAFERAVAGDLATPVLEDQVDALQALGEEYPDLDLTRVGILGWSFGGYLAALAVLRRPDVFHAAVAGAPVTDWTLYDTHYTERYLGHPDEQPDIYERSSLIADALTLARPLLLVHGLADDNVVAAHSLRLSSALLAAGRPHSVLPLSGVTHMTTEEVVAENLLLLQVQFLRDALGVPAPPA